MFPALIKILRIGGDFFFLLFFWGGQTAADEFYMKVALQLAERGRMSAPYDALDINLDRVSRCSQLTQRLIHPAMTSPIL